METSVKSTPDIFRDPPCPGRCLAGPGAGYAIGSGPGITATHRVAGHIAGSRMPRIVQSCLVPRGARPVVRILSYRPEDVHNAFHCALGLPGCPNDVVLWVMSLIMLGSMHAVRHLRHHRSMMGEDDVKAAAPRWRRGARCFSALHSRCCSTRPLFVTAQSG